MKRITLCGLFGLCFSGILVVMTGATRAGAAIAIVNPSFEEGLSGWSIYGTGIATTTTGFGTYSPQSGVSFLQLSVRGGTSLTVYQDFTATAGDTLSGWASMISAKKNLRDVTLILTVYNDLGEYVWSSNTTNSLTPSRPFQWPSSWQPSHHQGLSRPWDSLSQGGRMQGQSPKLDRGHRFPRTARLERLTTSTTGWQAWEWTALETGNYRLQYSLLNLGASKSIAVFDAPVPIPIPTTALLLASGLVGLGAVRRRMKK